MTGEAARIVRKAACQVCGDRVPVDDLAPCKVCKRLACEDCVDLGYPCVDCEAEEGSEGRCQTESCAEVAIVRIYWPGSEWMAMCLPCAARARVVGAVLGMHRIPAVPL